MNHAPPAGERPATSTVSAALSMLNAALTYHRQGLCVIPLDGKRPATASWKGFQQRRSSRRDLLRWEQQGLLKNIGIVCGAVSDNLAVLDFDGAGGYPAFSTQFPNLTKTLTIATGGGVGKHVYLRAQQLPPTTRAMDTGLGHIELRSSGTYVVAAPSLHPKTKRLYTIERDDPILRVDQLDPVVDWVRSFMEKAADWQPPSIAPAVDVSVNPRVIEAIAEQLRAQKHRVRGAWINCSCPNPGQHANGDRSPSFGFNTHSGYGHCYRCGSMLAKDLCQLLGIDPAAHGGLRAKPAVPEIGKPEKRTVDVRVTDPPPPPEEPTPAISGLELPAWLSQYVEWAAAVGNQTPLTFHLGMGIWMASVAIARRLSVETHWGVTLHSNLYMMFVAETTFYRKTTAYKLGERVLMSAIPHMLMPTPGSPERFQDALAGQAPANFNALPTEHQRVVLAGMRYAAQRGLFKDEIAGLFGSFKRDYMQGLKDFLLEVYDCPEYIAKETQSGLAVVRKAALSILGVTTPAGLSQAVTQADFDNGLLPRFALLTPEADYAERAGVSKPTPPPMAVVNGLKKLHEALPQPQQSGEGWLPAEALRMTVVDWQAPLDYSNELRRQCDPRRETPLDDRLKGIYGRLHVQAMKVAMICAALDWLEAGAEGVPIVERRHWQTGRAIAEGWRLSAGRLLSGLDRSGSARSEHREQERVLAAFRRAGESGVTLRAVYRNLNLKAKEARQIAQDLVRDGQLQEVSINGAEGYRMRSEK